MLLIFILKIANLFGSEKARIDSIERKICKFNKDTHAVKQLIQYGDNETSLSLKYRRSWYLKAIVLSNEINWEQGLALANFRLGRNYWSSGMFDSAIYYHKIALNKYKKLKDRFNEAYMLECLGQDYGDSSVYDVALEYFDKAMEIQYELKDKQAESYINSLRSWVYNAKGDYVLANQYQYKYLKYLVEKNDTTAMAYASISLGENYLNLKKYDQAIYNFKKWEPYWIAKKEYLMLSSISIGIGKTFRAMEKTNHAIRFLNNALTYASKVNNDYLMAEVFQELGGLYFDIRNYEACIIALNKSLSLSKAHNNRKRIFQINSSLSQCYIYTHKLDLAKKSIDNAELLSQIIDSRVTKMEFYKSKSLYESTVGNWKTAFNYNQKFQQLKDSIYNETNSKKIYEIQLDYEIEKKGIELKEESDKRKIFSILIAILLLLFIAFIIFARRKNLQILQMNKIVIQENEKQKILVKEIHHRVKNNLQMVTSFLQLQISKTKDIKGREVLDEAVNNMQSISLVYENLYQKENAEFVELKNYLQALISNLKQIGSNKKIEIQLDCDEIQLGFDTTISLGLIFNELITNSYKHGFKNSEGLIRISCIKSNNNLSIEYRDNGKGMAVPIVINKESLGLKLIELLISDLHGNYEISSNNGFQLNATILI